MNDQQGIFTKAMTWLFGANWKTTVSGLGSAFFGLLTILAALPYDLGAIADIFPPTWKAKIVIAGAIATTILKVWNSIAQKSKEVTGGSVQQTISGAKAEPGTQTMVDQTLVATKASGEILTPAQEQAVSDIKTK